MEKHTFLFTFLLTAILSIPLNAQFFNQFDHAPQLLNPAKVGNFDGEVRFNLNHRLDWIESQSFSPDLIRRTSIFLDGHSEVSDYYDFGLGLSLYTDQSEDLDFREDGIRFHMSGVKFFGDKRGTHQSIALGYSINRARQLNTTFELGYWTHSVGSVYRFYNGNRFRLEAGLALLEFNAPQLTIKEVDVYKVYSQSILHSEVVFKYNTWFHVMPALYTRFSDKELVTIVGSDVRNVFPKIYFFDHINVGAFIQVNNQGFSDINFEQLILRSSTKLEQVELGIALNTFATKSAINRDFSTIEFFFTYILGDSQPDDPVYAMGKTFGL